MHSLKLNYFDSLHKQPADIAPNAPNVPNNQMDFYLERERGADLLH